jgi:hypothetical protein
MQTQPPSLEQLWNELHRLAEFGHCKVRSLGKSSQGRDIPLLTVTDPAVADENKEVCILLAGEHGDEKSGPTSMLRLAEWLASRDSLAGEVRRTQVVHIIPAVNVDGYVIDRGFTAQDVDLYVAFSVSETPTCPEARAVWELVEETVPDAFVNLHGGRFEDTRRPFLNNTVAAFHDEVAEMMDLAADAAGFPQGRNHEFEEFPRIPDPLSRIARPGRPAVPFSSNVAAAAKKFHTLSVLMHTDGEDECVARLKKLLEIGSTRWPTEHYPGYPNRILGAQGVGLLSACGSTPAERRRSRAELCRNIEGLALLAASCAPGRDLLVLHRRTKPYIHHGAAVRFRIPKGSTVRSFTLNGDALSESEAHGYVQWEDPRWSVVQANILQGWPAGSTRAIGGDTLPADIAVLMLDYRLG